MKTLRMFAAILVSMLLCLNLSSCGDDDEKAPTGYPTIEELVNTVWTGSADDLTYEIKILNQDEVSLTVKGADGNIYVDSEELSYQYNEENGSITSEYNTLPVTGNVTYSEMTFTLNGQKVTLHKK